MDVQRGTGDFLRSPTLRAVALGFLILILQIPVALVSGLVGERQMRQQEAAAEIGEKWGQRQAVMGPFVEVPYRVDFVTVGDDGVVREHSEIRTHRFLPSQLAISGDVRVESRVRGIFTVPVYRGDVSISGELEVPDLSGLSDGDDEIKWDEARIVLEISDPSGIRSASALSWNAGDVQLEPAESVAGVQATVDLGRAGARHSFALSLDLAGSDGLFFVPAGEQSEIKMRSSWPHPSFQGSWLPETREVGPEGFSATWRVSRLARGFPSQWRHEDHTMMVDRLRASSVGVALMSSVDHYVMSARSTRYSVLFLLAVFAVVWLLEQRGKLRLHPLQYLLVGAALCCFHLMILAFSEHVGFEVAYLAAAGMVTALVVYYSRAVLGSALRSLVVGCTCLCVYAYLYVCLRNEDYALLIGSLGVFFGLAVVMALTRKLDWSRREPVEPATSSSS